MDSMAVRGLAKIASRTEPLIRRAGIATGIFAAGEPAGHRKAWRVLKGS